MKVLSHRGHWTSPAEKNTVQAFKRSFELGFGTETDVRDCGGRLLISHDMPRGDESTFREFAALVDRRDLPMAINIKADGLADAVAREAAAAGLSDWFVFDMSVPDLRAHLKAGNPVFTRMSEVEQDPVWLEQAQGVWLDGFDGTWFNLGTIEALLGRGKRVCVVSSELHGRDPGLLWQMLVPLAPNPALMLCTDLPEIARNRFAADRLSPTT